MRTRAWLLFLLAMMMSGGACEQVNPFYCEGHSNDLRHCDGRTPDAMPSSSPKGPCFAPTPVWDTSTMACVQCTAAEPSACTGPTPMCGTDNSCHGCTMHTQCSSNVCLPGGSCGTDMNVA